jgi:hypothetical protein
MLKNKRLNGSRKSDRCDLEEPVRVAVLAAEDSKASTLVVPSIWWPEKATEAAQRMQHAVRRELEVPTGFPMIESPRQCRMFGDYYNWRVHVALDAICKMSTPEGLVVWLDEHSRFLYQSLTREFPRKISRAWEDRIPLREFDALCFEFVVTYKRAVDLYGWLRCSK